MVVVAVIPVGGISSLPGRKAVFFLSHAVRFHIFTFPGPVHFCAVTKIKRRLVFFGALENGVERNAKRR